MGEVWLAEQHEPVRREVAVKVIKRGMDTRQVITRFQAERQALAMMDHPAIAHVLDAGETERGRPYFVMEYVRGVPITEYCDRHRLTVRERVELFRQVCEGVQHAHQKALIHRDLKPSNILVTLQQGQARPKIIDFGVAKATAQRLTDRTLFTELGQIIGTPEFMSPEQADLTGEDVDTRTDVYSLGAVLYTLLAGAMPFEAATLRGEGRENLRRMIRDEEPPRPSARVRQMDDAAEVAALRRCDAHGLVRQLDGDLDWIVMKALEKDRNRRYGSPQELSADLGRHHEDVPVEARPPSAVYRVGKFTRRHRGGVTAAATVLLLLVAFAVAMAMQARSTARERDHKEMALAEAEAVTRFLTDMLAAVDPIRTGRDATVREVLDSASGELGSAFVGRPAVESRLRVTIGRAYNALGLYENAEEQLRTAYNVRRGLFGEEHPETLQAMHTLANVYYNRGRYAEAESLHRSVLEARRRVLGDDHLDTRWSLGNLALTYYAQGRHDEAEPLLVEAVESGRRTVGGEHAQTLAVMNNLAALYHVTGRYTEAEALYRESLALQERILGLRHPDTLITRGNFAELLADQGRVADAAPKLAGVLADKRDVFGSDHPSTRYTMSVLAKIYRRQGRDADAAELEAELAAAAVR
jgi:tetratricopeptide (TPR) repeat protein